MKHSAFRLLVASAWLAGFGCAHAHVVLAEPASPAGTSYRATFRVGHGCDGTATTAIKVNLPPGFQGAKPMPRPGWTLTTRVEKLDKPYESHGQVISQMVTEVNWIAASKDSWLPDAHYDEFVIRGTLPDEPGPIWFKVLQTCEKGVSHWSDIPTEGTSTKGMKTPAVLLDVTRREKTAHQH